jgi:hypothetical protein
MLRIGVTGHTNLTELAAQVVYQTLVTVLRRRAIQPVRGVTCLADGADQIFAEALIAAGGTYEVILPADDYRTRAIRPENVSRFDALIRQAVAVSSTRFPESGDRAYAAANAELIGRSDRLVAIWDGRPDSRRGGTAHAVAMAQRAGVPVLRIWPAKARRTPRPPGPPEPVAAPTLAPAVC